jgi:fibro-slime domain-containing protein
MSQRLCLLSLCLLTALACGTDAKKLIGEGEHDDSGTPGDGDIDSGRPPLGDGDGDGDTGDGDAHQGGDGDVAPCGDSLVSAGEACDDGNTKVGDGCDDKCAIEPGYACPVIGARCRAAACGDKMLAGDEECEDGNSMPMDGCDERCRLEEGYACPNVGEACKPTKCGDSKTEGSEQCDDGNEVPFDGCFQCKHEPDCGSDGCKARCGDGIKFPDEACDDGNTRSADGCSAECALEGGFMCTEMTQAPPDFVDLPLILRDFRGFDLPAIPGANIAAGHPDFEHVNQAELGLVENLLAADKRPVCAKADGTAATVKDKASFLQWYHDDPMYNRTVVDSVRLTRNGAGDYVFYDATFFPLDTRGFVGESHEILRDGSDGMKHNFNFTSEVRTQFAYQGGETLTFKGDDDVWVFVNGRLAVDLGGVHGEQEGSVTLDPSGTDSKYALARGNIYEIVVFQAERHTSASTYQLTLRDFERAKTSCTAICGDGVLTPDEACDDGKDKNTGGYGECASDCAFGPRCGDGVVQSDHGEECDDQNRINNDACKNNCKNNIVL